MTEDLTPAYPPVGFELLAELERGGALTRVSLTLTDPDLTFERWLALGNLFGAVKRTASFLIGDWLNFGEAVYGEKYAQASDLTGLTPETLMVYASVCRRIARSRRREELSFGHHDAIAALEPAEQTWWLAAAVENGWSRRELRDALRAAEKLPPAPEQPDWTPTPPGEGAAPEAVLTPLPSTSSNATATVKTVNGRPFAATGEARELVFAAAGRKLIDEAEAVAEGYLVPTDAFEEFAAFFAAE